MWRFLSSRATLRERRPSVPPSSYNTKRFQHDVALQLDYYMSPQFAGVASALVNNTYFEKGLNLSFLPTCPVGREQQSVRRYKSEHPSHVALGTVEQNIFVPTLFADPTLRTTAVAAMFGTSPLCIASMTELPSSSPSSRPVTIGVHEDTVEIMTRIFPSYNILSSSRATKVGDLQSGSFHGIQAYTTTEVPTIRRLSGRDPIVVPLEGHRGARLGYGQVIFTADECLTGSDEREVVTAFCEATFEGWARAIRSDPEETAEMVVEAIKMLKLDDEANDHWHPSSKFNVEMLGYCCNHVKDTFEGDRYGVINAKRWNTANDWLLSKQKDSPKTNFGFDDTLWQPPHQLLSGNNLARSILDRAKASASSFYDTYGRRPSLAVVTVGDDRDAVSNERYGHGSRRLELYSHTSRRWFSKTSTGEANGFVVREIQLPSSTTTEELKSCLYNLGDDDIDGIQLMRPLPSHIDEGRVFNTIDTSKDVDGVHYIGQREIGNAAAYPPVTPAAVVALMEEYNVNVKGRRVLIVGRGPFTGSPLARMMRDEGGVVTVVHSEVEGEMLREVVAESDVIVSCAGVPGLIKSDWLKDDGDCVIISVGTTFDEDRDALVSDVDGDLSTLDVRYSPVPGGIGPLSAPMLFKNVATAAWNRMTNTGNIHSSGWTRRPSRLAKSFHYDDYTTALAAARKVNDMSTIMDHHANMTLTHHCTDGVDLELAFYSYEATDVTMKDYEAARAVDMMLGIDVVPMSRFSYNLKESSIAVYPANPRGSSKLLRYDDDDGRVSYHENFSTSFPAVAEGCHVVFNDSRVLEARLFVEGDDDDESGIEVMILDLGLSDLGETMCRDLTLPAMIRKVGVKRGDTFGVKLDGDGATVEIVEVEGLWEEDAQSGGNGTECIIRINSPSTVEEFLGHVGSVPIPPYLNRSSEMSDKESYNNTYAVNNGSVAAPTAGLHFTPQVMNQIGPNNCSYLSLHVGAGTFQPVTVKDARDHEMHAESFAVSVRELKSIIDALKRDKPLIVVGTTSSRTLESLYWCGVKRLRGLDDDGDDDGLLLVLGQFDWIPLTVGDDTRAISRIAALEALIRNHHDDADVIRGRTSLMITPPIYEFKVVDHLVTNFHAPDSTLMLLVSAFINDVKGVKISKIYEDAQDAGFRFLSYGDVCMFSRRGV